MAGLIEKSWKIEMSASVFSWKVSCRTCWHRRCSPVSNVYLRWAFPSFKPCSVGFWDFWKEISYCCCCCCCWCRCCWCRCCFCCCCSSVGAPVAEANDRITYSSGASSLRRSVEHRKCSGTDWWRSSWCLTVSWTNRIQLLGDLAICISRPWPGRWQPACTQEY